MTSEIISHHVPRWTFADRLRKIRRETGLSQAEFAARISAGEKAYGAWESDANDPRDIVAVARRIELAFGVPATWTLGLDEQVPMPGPNGPDGPGGDDGGGQVVPEESDSGDALRRLTDAKRNRRHAVRRDTRRYPVLAPAA